jgi:hypothetical protein
MKKFNDAFGYKRGAKGYGELGSKDVEFLKPDFNDAKLYRSTDKVEEVGSLAYTGKRFGVQRKNGEDR